MTAFLRTCWNKFNVRCCIALSATVIASSGNAFAQDLYVSVNNGGVTGSIARITPNGVASTFVSNINDPEDLKFDTSGNLYVGDYIDDLIYRITPTGAVSTFATLPGRPQGLVLGNNGDLYVGDGNYISKVTPSGVVTNIATFTDSQSFSLDLGIDSDGTLYSTNYNGTIYKVTTTGTVTSFVTGLSYPTGPVFDNSGNLFVADFDGTIDKITQAGTVTTLASGLNNPGGLVFSANGDLYTAAGGYGGSPSDTVDQITPSGTVSTFSTVAGIPIRLTIANSASAPEPQSVLLALLGTAGFTVRPRRRSVQ